MPVVKKMPEKSLIYTEKACGQLPVTFADFDKMPDFVKSPDCVIRGNLLSGSIMPSLDTNCLIRWLQ